MFQSFKTQPRIRLNTVVQKGTYEQAKEILGNTVEDVDKTIKFKEKKVKLLAD